jgi:hypothetical protein
MDLVHYTEMKTNFWSYLDSFTGTFCGINWLDGLLEQFTTEKENVACRECLRIMENKRRLL